MRLTCRALASKLILKTNHTTTTSSANVSTNNFRVCILPPCDLFVMMMRGIAAGVSRSPEATVQCDSSKIRLHKTRDVRLSEFVSASLLFSLHISGTRLGVCGSFQPFPVSFAIYHYRLGRPSG